MEVLVVECPGFSKPSRQYGAEYGSSPETGPEGRELDEVELGIWEKDGFSQRTGESTT